MHYNWKAWSRFHPATAAAPFFAELFAPPGIDVSKRSARADGAVIRDALLAAEPGPRRQLLEDYLRARALTTLGISIDEWDPSQPLTYLGVDSLMALEMKHDIEEELGVVIPVTQLLQAPTLEQIITVLLEQLDLQAQRRVATAVEADSPHVQPAVAVDDPAALLQRVDELPIEEVDTLLRSMGVGE
jgi:acyl carrier protein